MPLLTGNPFCERASASQPRTPRGGEGALCALRLNLLHRMEQDYPLNLSISLSGGKETNRDAPSNGE